MLNQVTTMYELCRKDVVNVRNGEKLGRVNDLQLALRTAQVLAIIIYGHRRCFGLFGREEDLVIPWARIEKIGDDVIFVNIDGLPRPMPPKPGGYN